MRKYLILLIVYTGFTFAGCNNSVRLVHGEISVATSLYEAAKKIQLGAWEDGKFGQEDFYYLGKLVSRHKDVYVTYIFTTWGAGHCGRATSRLIFFNENKEEIGQYYGVQQPIIQNSQLVFPNGEIGKSSVSIVKGLPEQMNDGNDYYPLSVYK